MHLVYFVLTKGKYTYSIPKNYIPKYSGPKIVHYSNQSPSLDSKIADWSDLGLPKTMIFTIINKFFNLWFSIVARFKDQQLLGNRILTWTWKIFWKVAWIQSHHVHLQWKFKLWAGKFAWCVKAKHCWGLSTNFWKQKSRWHHPAMLCLVITL